MVKHVNNRDELSKKLDKHLKDHVPMSVRAASHERPTSNRTKTTLDTDIIMNESRGTSLDTCNRSDNKLDIDEESEIYETMSNLSRDASETFSCIMDLPPDTTPRLPNKHSFKTSYRLTKEEINHPSLNLEARLPQSNTSYRHTNLSHAREKVDLSGLSTREHTESSSSYRQAQSVPHSRTIIDRSSLPSQPAPQETTNLRNAPYPSPNRPDMNANTSNMQSPRPDRPTSFRRLIRWVNHRPFFHFDQIFGSFPSMFRGFDENGFFFFSMNADTDAQEEQKEPPSAATKEEIEKAVSQLTGLSSDLEIKKGDSCPICLEQFKTTDDAVQMPCPCKRTFFHRQCAVKTLEMTKKIKCPNCRRWNAN